MFFLWHGHLAHVFSPSHEARATSYVERSFTIEYRWPAHAAWLRMPRDTLSSFGWHGVEAKRGHGLCFFIEILKIQFCFGFWA